MQLFQQLPEYLYVGGFETALKTPDVVKTPFEGCLGSIQLQSISVNMRDNVLAYKITPGCQNKVVCPFIGIISIDGDLFFKKTLCREKC